MVFSSIDFIFKFLPVFTLIYYIIPKKFKNGFLFAGSLFFYAWGERFYLFLLLFSIIINYIFGRRIYREALGSKRRKIYMICAVAADFAILAFFKYINFIFDNIHFLFHTERITLSVTLPLGISFYTFQIVSYIIDVYRGNQKEADNIITLDTYICMFPQLVAGPIVTFRQVDRELRDRTVTLENLEEGLKIFVLGLGSKVILANQIGSLWTSASRYGYDSISTPFAWLCAFAYSFQIYFDFFGYSVMAIGLGKMLGFEIPKNFDNPYTSSSMSEFWRRWHMTLGSWFKDYVYFPLGGSRCETKKIIRNTFIVWAFTGLWHGASWNFVIWGLSFFVFLTLERFVYGKALAETKIIKHLYVIFFIPLTWVIFALTDFSEIVTYFSRLFPFGGTPDFITTDDFTSALRTYWYILAACVLFSLPFPERFYKKYKDSKFMILILAFIFGYSIYRLKVAENNPFLYFRF